MGKPILFSGEMVRAIMDGRKTQTRRVIPNAGGSYRGYIPERNTYWFGLDLRTVGNGPETSIEVKCPYGKPGDLLWVRETHWRYGYWEKRQANKREPEKWRFVGLDDDAHPVLFAEPDNRPVDRVHVGYHKRPSIFMPRFASRIMLPVMNVRAERVQQIDDAGAVAEWVRVTESADFTGLTTGQPVKDFMMLWDSINAKRGYSWDSNPWVWVVEFEVVT